MIKRILFYSLAFLLTSFFSEAQSINNMWTMKEGKTIRVFDFAEGEIERNLTDISNTLASARNRMKILKNINTDAKNGRFVVSYKVDAETHFCVLDYFNLTEDSVIIAEQEPFENVDAAFNAGKDKSKGKVYYSNEYLYRITLLKKIPVLTKEQYLAFLKDANKEILKPEVKKKVVDNTKPFDIQIQAFLLDLMKKKEYEGKIVPERLAKAKEKFKNEDAVKRSMMHLKMNFIPKPVATTTAK